MFKITPRGQTAPYRSSFDLLNVFRDFERDFFGGEMPVNSVKTDIREEADKYVLEAEMPGFGKDDIKIDVEGDYLTLSAERSSEKEDKDGGYIRRERSYGSFKRSFNIESVDSEKIEAEYKNGVLSLSLPKKGEKTPNTRRLEIK
ncbi:MAG: Hsp20/alpha crystallin family protein [Oscillospiraceae bacterium]|jgi:HSP20 family protein|nr:Hsp20/alpha crystallin family protein [Oscillospiraceae bacterium]